MFGAVEEQVRFGVEWLRLLVETLGALVIGVGVVLTVAGLARHALSEHGLCKDSAQVFLRQFTAQTFWLRPRIFLLTNSGTGLWRPHLKHDILVE